MPESSPAIRRIAVWTVQLGNLAQGVSHVRATRMHILLYALPALQGNILMMQVLPHASYAQ